MSLPSSAPPNIEPHYLPIFYGARRVLLSNCGRRIQKDKALPLVASLESSEAYKRLDDR